MHRALLLCLVACKPAEPPLVDLNASLEPVQRDFNAHRGEARFLTLLSPT